MEEKLYFCDGEACEEYQKKCCYMYGGECHHTRHIEHSLSAVTTDFPPTKFIGIRSGSTRVEIFDEEAIFKRLSENRNLNLKFV